MVRRQACNGPVPLGQLNIEDTTRDVGKWYKTHEAHRNGYAWTETVQC